MSFFDERDMASATYAESWERSEAVAKSSGASNRIEKGVRLLRKEAAPELRMATGVVMEPVSTPDSQGDVISAPEIEAACYAWNESRYGQVAIQHDEGTIADGRIKVIESFIAPQDLAYPDGKVVKGSWVMTIKFDPDLWTKVKAGEITGLSIGGTAQRTPAGAS